MRLRNLLLIGTTLACLAVAVPAYAYWTASGNAGTTVEAAALSVPSATVAVTATDITVTVDPPTSGPAPTSYTVTRGDSFTCALDATRRTCPADQVGAAVTVRYEVTARLGEHWRRSTILSASTAPPPPIGLLLEKESDSGVPGDGITERTDPVFDLTVTQAATRYTVTLYDNGTPLVTVEVSAGAGEDCLVAAVPAGHRLRPGRHTITAVASLGSAASAATTMAPQVLEVLAIEPTPTPVPVEPSSPSAIPDPVLTPHIYPAQGGSAESSGSPDPEASTR